MATSAVAAAVVSAAAVVNAAGAILLAGITRTSEAQYRDCLAANLDTAFFTAKAYVAALQQAQKEGGSGGGRLLMFSSVAAGRNSASRGVSTTARPRTLRSSPRSCWARAATGSTARSLRWTAASPRCGRW